MLVTTNLIVTGPISGKLEWDCKLFPNSITLIKVIE